MKLKLIPPGQGFDVITEAVTTEFCALMDLVRQAVRDSARIMPGCGDCYVDMRGIWADKAVVQMNGRLYSFPYTVAADNTVQVGTPTEVVLNFSAVREAAAAAGLDVCMRESADGSIEVTIIRAGLSLNGNFYSDKALKDGVPLFEGVRLFVKSDEVHTKGGGKDVRNLLGGIFGVRFVPGAEPDTGSLVGTFKAIDPADPAVTKMTEAVKRGLQGLMGLSIDATGQTKRETRDGKAVRVLQRFGKVNSVDLIVEPGAGGGLDRLAEAATTDPTPATPSGEEPMFKKTLLLAAVAALAGAAAQATILTEAAPGSQVFKALEDGCKAKGVNLTDVIQVLEGAADEAAVTAGVARLVEAARVTEAVKPAGDDKPLTQADLVMFRVREAARTKVAACGLPTPARERLQHQLDTRDRFTEADVDELIKGERAYLARMTESGAVRMGGEFREGADIQVGGSQVVEMLDAFFDPAHKNHRNVHSFKECYIAITGDRKVTGELRECNRAQLRESLGALAAADSGNFREAMDSTTLANALGNSITRRLLQVYGQQTDLQAWRRIASVTSVSDFRSQERATVGGYGNLPAVAEGASYNALTSPTDLKATYTVSKRGGTEQVTLEMIKNDDVGAIRRIPVDLALAAANTLFEFVFDFPRANAAIYDTVALYHASHNNLFVAALSATEFATHRLAMAKQTRLGSAKRRGVTPKTLLVPFDLQETAFNLFQRNQNLDKTFVNSQQPDIIVVPYWTDTNDWCTVADPMVMPFLEIGFLDGKEDPELFTQDMPNVGNLFTNDKLTWKIRHIYSGAVLPEGEKATTKAVVP